MNDPDILAALRTFIRILEENNISYYIGGSIASSIYGMARATLDIDIVADIKLKHVAILREQLQEYYYIDEEMVKEAIVNKSTFNLIHLETAIKIDVFIRKDDAYQQSAFQRKLKDNLEEDDLGKRYYFSSPEDTIINKLIWYEWGGRISTQQWSDVGGVIKVQGDLLDKNYIKEWSEKLKIKDLAEKAFEDAGVLF